MSEAKSKRCAKCGLEKPIEDFYPRGGKTRHGKPVPAGQRKNQCKACDKLRIAKRLAIRTGKEYEPLTEYRGRLAERKRERLANRPKSQRQQEIELWKASGMWEWVKALRKAEARAKSKLAARMAYHSDPWHRRFASTLKGMEHRRKLQPYLKPKKRKARPTSWTAVLARSLGLAKAAWKRQIKISTNPWYRTMETKARNWRRKVAGKRRSQPKDC